MLRVLLVPSPGSLLAGDEVVVIKNGTRLCGSGGCLATASIVQDKSYFEVKIQREGTWGVGLSSGTLDVNKIPFGNDKLSWVLREDGKIYHNGEAIGNLPEVPRESDVLVSSFGAQSDRGSLLRLSRSINPHFLYSLGFRLRSR